MHANVVLIKRLLTYLTARFRCVRTSKFAEDGKLMPRFSSYTPRRPAAIYRSEFQIDPHSAYVSQFIFFCIFAFARQWCAQLLCIRAESVVGTAAFNEVH